MRTKSRHICQIQNQGVEKIHRSILFSKNIFRDFPGTAVLFFKNKFIFQKIDFIEINSRGQHECVGSVNFRIWNMLLTFQVP
jgi:hypothetical protein